MTQMRLQLALILCCLTQMNIILHYNIPFPIFASMSITVSLSLLNYFVGIMTTSRALYAIFLLLLKNPDIQRKAQQEIDQAIGKRTPNISDRSRCPFVESMLLEALRYITHSTIGVPHETTIDTTLQGYSIPSGTQVSMGSVT